MIKFMYAKNVVYIINYNMMILCQGREDNPLHTDAFNVYCSKIWRKKIQFGVRPLLIVNVQLQGRFLWKKIAMESA